MRKIILSVAFLFFTLAINAQDNFNIDELPSILVRELNKFRIKNGLDTFEVNQVLVDASAIDGNKFAKSGAAKVDPEKVKKNLVKAGGTKKGEEVTMLAPVSKGRDNYKTEEVAKVIWTRWENNKKDLILRNYLLHNPFILKIIINDIVICFFVLRTLNYINSQAIFRFL